MFAREVERLAAAVKALPRDPGVPEILMPGERAARTHAQRSRDGIPLPARVVEELTRAGEKLGVALFWISLDIEMGLACANVCLERGRGVSLRRRLPPLGLHQHELPVAQAHPIALAHRRLALVGDGAYASRRPS